MSLYKILVFNSALFYQMNNSRNDFNKCENTSCFSLCAHTGITSFYTGVGQPIIRILRPILLSIKSINIEQDQKNCDKNKKNVE